jgi:hypothetical protein
MAGSASRPAGTHRVHALSVRRSAVPTDDRLSMAEGRSPARRRGVRSNKHINLTNHDSNRRLEPKGSIVVCRLRAYR